MQQVGGSLGTALLNTIAATATASYIASHGRAFVLAGTVHGFTVAFAVGSVLLLLASISCAVFINVRRDELTVPEVAPATA
jgi:hypothetical protein